MMLEFPKAHPRRGDTIWIGASEARDVNIISDRWDKLCIKKLSEDAELPTRANNFDLGYDLYSNESVRLHPGVPTKVHTGIACQFPMGYGAIIKDRSGMAIKHSVHVVAGVIDNGYTGEIIVVMANYGKDGVVIEKGQKFAQMILHPVIGFSTKEVTELESSDNRGVAGFGSTGH